MPKSKKKSAPTAATVQSANTIQQNQDSTICEKFQEISPRELKTLRSFALLSEDNKNYLLNLADLLLKNYNNGEAEKLEEDEILGMLNSLSDEPLHDYYLYLLNLKNTITKEQLK